MNQNKTKIISKHLSYILRHKPDVIGLQLDPNGWANINELISKSPKISNREQISTVVTENDKQRFIISEDGTRIRANQGHSISIDLGLKSVSPPIVLYHGTATRFIDLIMDQGLKKMNRHHVHLSADFETAMSVGSRHGKPVILQINVAAMVEGGHHFYMSKNNVWLTEAVPVDFLSQA